MRSLRGGSGGRGGGGGGRDGAGTVTVEVGGDVVDVADLQAGGAVHRPSAAVVRRLTASTLQRKLAGAAVEVVVNGHRQTTSNLIAVVTTRLHHNAVSYRARPYSGIGNDQCRRRPE